MFGVDSLLLMSNEIIPALKKMKRIVIGIISIIYIIYLLTLQ